MTQPVHSSAIDVLKAVAALLIINSHLEHLYPKPWMAGDGLLGITIFFFTTGFTLAGSLRRHPGEGLLVFLWKRISRMYPAVWIVLLLLPPRALKLSSWQGIAAEFVYPTPYSFVAVIVPLYPVFFLLLRARLRPKSLLLLSAAMMIVSLSAIWFKTRNAGVDIPLSALGGPAFIPHLGAAMLLGAVLADENGFLARARIAWWLPLCLAGVYFFVRFACTAAAPAALLPLRPAMTLLMFPVCLGTLACSLMALSSPRASEWMQRGGAIPACILFVAANTWETYVLHEGVARWSWIGAAGFPWSILLVFAMTLALAPVLHRISSPTALSRLFSSRRTLPT